MAVRVMRMGMTPASCESFSNGTRTLLKQWLTDFGMVFLGCHNSCYGNNNLSKVGVTMNKINGLGVYGSLLRWLLIRVYIFPCRHGNIYNMYHGERQQLKKVLL